MPRFYFDTDDGTTMSTDSEGLDLANVKAARDAALQALPDMARDLLPDGDHRTFVVKVRNDHDSIIYTATLFLNGKWSI